MKLHHALNPLMAVAAALAVAIPAMTYDEPRIGSDRSSLDVLETTDWYANQPANVPAWTPELAAEFPGCIASDLGGDTIPTTSVVVNLDGTIRRVSTSVAWERAENARPNTYWIIGSCA